MKNASLPYNQRFCINGTGLSGVQSIDGNYGVNEQNVNFAGFGYVTGLISQPMQGNFTISRALIGDDPWLSFTGDGTSAAFSGSVFYERPNVGGTLDNNFSGCFGFHSGYLNSYNISCGIGEIPSVQVSISVYGDLGPGIDVRPAGSPDGTADAEIRVPDQGGIVLTCDGSSTNRITSFSHNIELPRTALYALPNGAAADLTADSVKWKMPVQVDLSYPIESTTNFTLEIDDYETKNLYGALTGIHVHSTDITINDDSGSEIVKFDLTKSRLISESFTSEVGGAVTVNLTYKKYSNKR
jgi:hypothetical protein|tara:strand:+ start:1789 stop:2682 length:894 start_codon:yes stop_codon:yes gene_type:complete